MERYEVLTSINSGRYDRGDVITLSESGAMGLLLTGAIRLIPNTSEPPPLNEGLEVVPAAGVSSEKPSFPKIKKKR